ncbi:MAG: TRAP transporter substrate-binding protein [Candidatus Tectomicrobia bacterium]|uniref:TRAP transporter substrate-binding protein n=1 Tax=Tectimicrobiota bacterium TaxID=2528274 RepID=A0A937W0T0_UNCTE|nr:TRAP transporter substrate-binding protein [Candidatus Tectomicrobia bacterium]
MRQGKTPPVPATKSVSRRGLIRAAAGAAAVGVAMRPQRAIAQEKVSLKFQSGFPPKEPFHLIAVDWAKKIDEISGGRLKIELLPGGAVVPPFQVLDAIHTGTLDGGVGVPAYWFGKQVAFSLFGTGPSWGLDAEQMLGWIYYGGGQQLYDELVQKELKLDVQSFFLGPMPTQPLGWFKKGEIQKPEDLKGLKYRTVGLSADLFKQMGASVVILPGAEIVPALDRGVIDGAEWNNTSSDKTLGLQDVSKTYMVQSHHQSNEYLEILFNKKKLDTLPKDLQAIVRYAIMAESADMTWKFQDWNSRDLEELKSKYNVKVVKTPKAVLDAQLKAWDALLAEKAKDNPFFTKIMESQKAWAKRVGTWRQEIMVDQASAYEHFFKKG